MLAEVPPTAPWITSIAAQLLWAVVGAVVGILLKPVWDFVASRRGEYTGVWTQTIPAFEGEPEKIATVKIWHVGDRLYGRTERTAPKLQFVQRWKVEARLKRSLAFGMYWPEDSSKLPGSYGTLQFKILHENLLVGFYVRVRPREGGEPSAFQENLRLIPIRWERILPKQP
jgi:hypothetical protein